MWYQEISATCRPSLCKRTLPTRISNANLWCWFTPRSCEYTVHECRVAGVFIRYYIQFSRSYSRSWTPWMLFVTEIEPMLSASVNLKTLNLSTKVFSRRDQMLRFSCHSDFYFTDQRNFSFHTRTTDTWVFILQYIHSFVCHSAWGRLLNVWFFAFAVAPTGDHVISLVDEISYVAPPAPPLSQIDDIPPEQFCNGDNRPPDCGQNCMCTHKVDIPLNAIVEVVLVDEGRYHLSGGWGMSYDEKADASIPTLPLQFNSQIWAIPSTCTGMPSTLSVSVDHRTETSRKLI